MLYWLISIAALIGVWLNIRKHVGCFWIWVATNATWAVVDYTHGIYSQATLQAIYCALSIYGIWQWSRPVKRQESAK